MPDDRVAAIFGDALIPQMAGAETMMAPVKADDAYVRTLYKIPETFGIGATKDNWNQQASVAPVGGIHAWAGSIQAARRDIARAAGHDPEDFDHTVNNVWQHFAGSHTAECPSIFEFADLDAEIAIKAAYPQYPMEAAVGFGGTNDTDISSRMFGWVMPAFSFAQAFQRARLTPPEVRVFFAHELSSDVNPDLDADRARQVSARIGAAVSQFATFTIRSSTQSASPKAA